MSNTEKLVIFDDSETEPDSESDLKGVEPLPMLSDTDKAVVFDDSETEPDSESDLKGLESLPEKKESPVGYSTVTGLTGHPINSHLQPEQSFKMEDLVKRIVEASEARRRNRQASLTIPSLTGPIARLFNEFR